MDNSFVVLKMPLITGNLEIIGKPEEPYLVNEGLWVPYVARRNDEEEDYEEYKLTPLGFWSTIYRERTYQKTGFDTSFWFDKEEKAIKKAQEMNNRDKRKGPGVIEIIKSWFLG